MKLVLAKEKGPFRSRLFCFDDEKAPIYTPLFIPSVSSTVHSSWRKTVRALAHGAAGRGFVLVSAFDLAADDPLPKTVPGFRGVVLDSGGYEARRTRSRWSEKRFKAVAERLRVDIVVGHDPVGAEDEDAATQVRRQTALFAKLGKRPLRTLLIHGDHWQRKLPAFVSVLLEEANNFEILGIAEKELGVSMIDRVRQVARLRDEMDRAGIVRPLHIFGTDDPLSLVLYSAAGADIFDGLGWTTEFVDGQTLTRHDLSHGPLSPRWAAFCQRVSDETKKPLPIDAGLTMEWNIEQFDNLLAEVRRTIFNDETAVFYDLCARSPLNAKPLLEELAHGR